MTGFSTNRRWPPVIVCGLALWCGAWFLGGCQTNGGQFKGSQLPTISHSADVGWNPLNRPTWEPDTLYLLDAAQESKLAPGDGGLMAWNPEQPNPWRSLAVVPGKFRPGLKSLGQRFGYAWMPSLGLIAPDEFTLEAWLRCDRPWAEVIKSCPLSIADEHGAVALKLWVQGGWLRLDYGHKQDPAGPVQTSVFYDVLNHPLAAGAWVSVAVTYQHQTLTLYINGEAVGQASGLRPPQLWSDAAHSDGLCLLGSAEADASQFSLSDLRISRYARTLHQPDPQTAPDTLFVQANKPTGARVRQTLLGGLHTLGGAATEQMAQGVLRVLRTDKMLVATPIKAGAPDKAHPVAGHSGRYAYDWQVVDRTLDYYQRLHVVPYISLDATPQLLGGKVAPLDGRRLATLRSGRSDFPTEVPNDMAAFKAIVGDLVHHIIREKGYQVLYWGVWNEPDYPKFWNGTIAQYLQLYDACAQAVKAVDPRLKIGGPETSTFAPLWIEPLIQHCAERQVPLDFISWHYYASTLSEIPQAKAQISYWTHQYKLAQPPALIVGEWCWETYNLPGTGVLPWRAKNYYLNDWHAAFAGASLIEMQRAGVLYSIYTNPVAEAGASSFEASGLMSSQHPWANLNVFRLWSKLAPTIVSTRYEGRPGIFALAARDKQGRLTILLTHLRYRKDVTATLTLRLAGLAKAPAQIKITHYIVDDRHSNAFDAGSDHRELETVPPPSLNSDGVGTLTLRPRSVHLLVLE